MPTPASIDAWLANGAYDRTFGETDDYWQSDATSALGHLIDLVLSDLPRPQRRSIELYVVAGYSYRDAARELDLYVGSPPKPDGKKVWRFVQRGLADMREQIAVRLSEPAGWESAFAGDRIPDIEQEGS